MAEPASSPPGPAGPVEARPPSGARRRSVLVVGLVLGIVGLAAGGAWIYASRAIGRLDRSRQKLVERTADLAARHERPVLRGESIDGDALATQLAAISALHLDDAMISEWSKDLRAGGPFTGSIASYASAHQEELTALRAAARRPWLVSRADALDPSAALAAMPSYLDGWKLLLVQASAASPRACLETCADVLRLAGDASLRGGLIDAMIGAVAPDLVAPIAVRCAGRAAPEEVDRAVRELRVLVDRTPAIGIAFGWEVIQQSNALSLVLPERPSAFQIVKLRGELGALEWMLADATPWPTVTALDYAASLAKVEDYGARMKASGLDVLEGAEISPRYLQKSAQVLAKTRALVVALAAVADAPTSAAVITLLAEPDLRDPFGGGSLLVEVDSNGAFRIASPGADGRRASPLVPSDGSDDDAVVSVPAR